VYSATGGIIQAYSTSYTIAGSAPQHAVCNNGATVNLINDAITLTGAPTFSTAFVSASASGEISVYGGTAFSGAVGASTSPRYLVGTDGIIQTNGAGASFFPGNTAGSSGTQGLYL
jgi:hypothetical protein